MTIAWNYDYTPQIWPAIFTVFLLLVVAGVVWRKRSVPGAVPFFIGLLFAILWATGSILEYSAVDLSTKIFWVKFQAIWQIPSATTMTCFLLEYVWPGRWLTKRNLVLLAIIPLLVMGLILTENLHHLVWGAASFKLGIGTNITHPPFGGPASWVIVGYIYLLGVVNLIVLVWLFLRSPMHRWPVVLILFAQISGRLLYTFESNLTVQTALPFDVLLLLYMALFYFVALFVFRLFNPVALARQTVMEQLNEGVLVLDHQGRVVSLNPAAEKIFGAPIQQVKGSPIQEILSYYPQENLESKNNSTIELSLNMNGSARDFSMAISTLNDWHGFNVGRLLLLQDVTERNLAQAKLLEQQRTLATLKERNRLARDLHDELAQDLNLINMQAQLVSGLLEAGQDEEARKQLLVLAKAAREAHLDIRGEIGKLTQRVDSIEGFPGSLRYITTSFQESNGVEVELTLPDDLSEISIAPSTEVQLLRIVQESFTNIRKHAQAKHVHVELSREPDRILLLIQDDGVGFEPAKIPVSKDSYGLGIMSQRAAEVGSQLEISSTPGKGTKIRIEVPLI